MNGSYGIGAAEAYDEGIDDSIDDAYDDVFEEARRQRIPSRPVATAARGNAYRPRPSNTQAQVTQAQLQAALARVGTQINTNSAAIKMVDGRVRAASAEQERLLSAQRKESAERKKALESVRKDLQSTREISAILPLLTTLGGGSGIAAFAPLLLLGDIGGTGGSSDNTSGTGGLLGGGITGIVTLLAITGAFTK